MRNRKFDTCKWGLSTPKPLVYPRWRNKGTVFSFLYPALWGEGTELSFLYPNIRGDGTAHSFLYPKPRGVSTKHSFLYPLLRGDGTVLSFLYPNLRGKSTEYTFLYPKHAGEKLFSLCLIPLARGKATNCLSSNSFLNRYIYFHVFKHSMVSGNTPPLPYSEEMFSQPQKETDYSGILPSLLKSANIIYYSIVQNIKCYE
jgi:hypothetical protein